MIGFAFGIIVGAKLAQWDQKKIIANCNKKYDYIGQIDYLEIRKLITPYIMPGYEKFFEITDEWKYLYSDKDDAEFTRKDFTDLNNYIKTIFNCENFGWSYKVAHDKCLPNGCIAVVVFRNERGVLHKANLRITENKEVRIREPQDDDWYEPKKKSITRGEM